MCKMYTMVREAAKFAGLMSVGCFMGIVGARIGIWATEWATEKIEWRSH
jgi:hypothetical protein